MSTDRMPCLGKIMPTAGNDMMKPAFMDFRWQHKLVQTFGQQFGSIGQNHYVYIDFNSRITFRCLFPKEIKININSTYWKKMTVNTKKFMVPTVKIVNKERLLFVSWPHFTLQQWQVFPWLLTHEALQMVPESWGCGLNRVGEAEQPWVFCGFLFFTCRNFDNFPYLVQSTEIYLTVWQGTHFSLFQPQCGSTLRCSVALTSQTWEYEGLPVFVWRSFHCLISWMTISMDLLRI